MDWFLYNTDLHHERVKSITPHYSWENREKNNPLPSEKRVFHFNYTQSHASDDINAYLKNLTKSGYSWACLATPN